MNAAISPGVLAAANAKSRELKALVAVPEILVMPGAYDVISSQLFQHLGFKAIQGTSGGIAAADGYADGEVIARTDTLNATGEMARAVDVPVNADGEKGYGDAEETAWLVREFIGRGVAGMNLEESAHPGPSGKRRLVPIESPLEKIRVVVSTRSGLGSEFFLNARVDAFMTDDSPAACPAQAIERGNAYAGLGADSAEVCNCHPMSVITDWRTP